MNEIQRKIERISSEIKQFKEILDKNNRSYKELESEYKKFDQQQQATGNINEEV